MGWNKAKGKGEMPNIKLLRKVVKNNVPYWPKITSSAIPSKNLKPYSKITAIKNPQ